MGRNVLQGDPSDVGFWEKIAKDHCIKLVMLALPNLQANLDALAELRENSFSGRIAATARYPDEVTRLQQSEATAVFLISTPKREQVLLIMLRLKPRTDEQP